MPGLTTIASLHHSFCHADHYSRQVCADGWAHLISRLPPPPPDCHYSGQVSAGQCVGGAERAHPHEEHVRHQPQIRPARRGDPLPHVSVPPPPPYPSHHLSFPLPLPQHMYGLDPCLVAINIHPPLLSLLPHPIHTYMYSVDLIISLYLPTRTCTAWTSCLAVTSSSTSSTPAASPRNAPASTPQR